MLPVAAVLAIAGLGQMLVVQQGGIDLSVAGGISLALVIVTHIPDGDNAKLVPAILLAVLFAVAAGVLNGGLIGGLGLNPIIATLGTNALLYGVNLGISVFFALGALAVVSLIVKRTVAGRRFEAVGANPRAARAMGLRVRSHQSLSYVWAQLLYCLGGILIAGITSQPIAYAGDTFLLPSVAVVVLGGTSLLGGRGYPLATVVAAVFLQQLTQLVDVLGVSPAISPLVQAVALAVGVSLYTVNWGAVWASLTRRRRTVAVVS
jgi:ribose transport system permease protein